MPPTSYCDAVRALPAALLAGTALLLSGGAPAAAAGPTPPGALRLPAPGDLDVGDLLAGVGARADRRLASVVPGHVRNDEVVRVGLDGAGGPRSVQVEQRLRLTGTGDYSVRERGPARSARGLGEDPPPVTKLGTVVWQGFSPGGRDVAAVLALDPVLEAPRLPLAVALRWAPPGRPEQPLGPGGTVPAAGTVTVRLRAQTAQPAPLPTALDAPAAALAGPLDTARRAATAGAAGAGGRLPAAGAGLPRSVPATEATVVQDVQAVPLRIAGRLTAPGATGAGPGTTAVPDGVRLAGTLTSGEVAFTLSVPGPTTLALDLQAVPTLDPRTLAPPGAASWAAWAAGGPDRARRRAALDLLVRTAAAGARAAAYAPYLGADLPGGGTTVFRWALAPSVRATVVRAPLTPHRGALALAGLAGLLVAGTGAGVWRAS